jgi:small multidrug resistance pump
MNDMAENTETSSGNSEIHPEENFSRAKNTGQLKSWALLLLAILCEVSATTSVKLSRGLTNLVPTLMMFVFYASGFLPLTFAMKKIDISVAYAIWSGLGTAIITTIGIFWFHEPVTVIKIVCISLIIAGVAGLYLCDCYQTAL